MIKNNLIGIKEKKISRELTVKYGWKLKPGETALLKEYNTNKDDAIQQELFNRS